MRTRDEIRALLQGPVCSIPTTFTRQGALDEAGIRSVIDVALGGGSHVVMLTWFDSLFPLLTDEEVYRLTRLVVEHVSGRALVIAADRSWWTGKAVEFATWCRDLGADLLMVRPPQLATTLPDKLAEHYTAVSQVMPVMLVGNVPRETLAALSTGAPGVVAFKDDIGGSYGLHVARRYAKQWALVTAGYLWEHVALWPYGARGWLSNFIIFAPQVDEAYWAALQQGDMTRVRETVINYDEPWWDEAATFPGGADGLWHATLEVFGVALRWRRAPFGSASDADLERLRGFYRRLGLLP